MSMRDTRLWLIVGGVAAVIVLFFLLRPSDDESAGTTTAITAPTVGTTNAVTVTVEEPTTTAPAETVPEEAAVQRFAATLADGAVVGGIQRWQVAEGDRVRIVVRSDVDDELHLHGYDITKNVAPGAPAIFAFPATLPGRFELEAHHAGGQIAQLDVQP